MTLYDRCVDLQLSLEAAQSADASLDLVAKANRLVEALDGASTYLAGVVPFKSRMNIQEAPALNAKAVSEAVRAFRAGLSRHGAAAFQHQPASKLVDVATDQQRRTARWAVSRWRANFDRHQPLIERAQPDLLVGNSSHRATAQARAATLNLVRGLDPIADRDKLEAKLGGDDGGEDWLDTVDSIAAELARALQAMDDDRAAFTPEVQNALEMASSDTGLPLSDVTPSLLEGLRAAGVVDDFVVRRP